jgi:small subunit ribosomal protein S3
LGQKVHPYGIRLGYTKPWKARWYSAKDYSRFLLEDLRIRKFLKKQMVNSGVSQVDIERSAKRLRVIIHTARPGIVIGRRGSEIDRLRSAVERYTKAEVFIDIKEVKSPQTDAQLVAQAVAQQLERRIAFRRAMKKAVSLTMQKGAEGIKIQCKGRLGGAEIARTEKYKDGKIPLSTFRADVDYGFIEANTTYGAIGVKVWIYKGDFLMNQARAAQLAAADESAQQQPVRKGKKRKGE